MGLCISDGSEEGHREGDATGAPNTTRSQWLNQGHLSVAGSITQGYARDGSGSLPASPNNTLLPRPRCHHAQHAAHDVVVP